MAIYEQGETYVHWATIRDKDDAKVDPSTVSITITAPNGSNVVSSQSMVSDTTGVYYYNHNLSSTASYGKYTVTVDATSAAARHGIIKDEFFVMPWKLEKSIRRKTGVSENDISDEDLSHVAWMSYKESLRDVYNHHFKESPKGNPDTGVGFNGSNASFQTHNFPIADIGGDGTIGDSDDDESDITCWWIDNAGHRNTGYVNITQADNGEITIYQSGGVSPIPSNNEGVYLDYWTEYESFDSFLFKEAVSYLASHYVNLRLTELDRVTLADLNVNKPVILKMPNRFIREYKRILNHIRSPKISGV